MGVLKIVRTTAVVAIPFALAACSAGHQSRLETSSIKQNDQQQHHEPPRALGYAAEPPREQGCRMTFDAFPFGIACPMTPFKTTP